MTEDSNKEGTGECCDSETMKCIGKCLCFSAGCACFAAASIATSVLNGLPEPCDCGDSRDGDDESTGECCCRCWFKVIGGLVPIAFLLLLIQLSAISFLKPKFAVDHFYVPALDIATNFTTSGTIINLALKFINEHQAREVYYDAINVTLYENPSRLQQIGNFTIPAFHQGLGKDTVHMKSVETSNVNWTALREAVAKEPLIFLVDVDTKVRYDCLWKTGRHKLKREAKVRVNDHGMKI